MSETPLVQPTDERPEAAPLRSATSEDKLWMCILCGAGDNLGKVCLNCRATRQHVPPPDVFLLNTIPTKIVHGIVFESALILVGLFIVGLALNNWRTVMLRKTEGITVQGQVADLRIKTDSEGSESYYVTYRFLTTTERGLFVREQSVSGDFYNSVNWGSPVRVTYYPSDPGMSWMEDGSYTELVDAAIPTVIAVVWYVLAFGMIIVGVLSRRWRKRLGADGKQIRGEILSCSRSISEEYDLRLVVKYAFHSPIGKRITGEKVITRNDLLGEKLPAAGHPVLVIYADDKCYEIL